MLQLRMLKAVPQYAGLNYAAFQAARPLTNQLSELKQHIVHGDLLCRYLNLSVALQNEMALSIGTTPRKILDNLTEIARFTQMF